MDSGKTRPCKLGLDDKTLNLKMNRQALNKLRGMMPGSIVVEIDLFMMLNGIRDKHEERPYFPFMLMLADHDSGFILGNELLKPLPSMEAMWEQIPAQVAEILAKEFAPKEILIRDDLLAALLQPLAEEVGFKIKKQSRLTAIGRARRSLERFF